MQLPQTVDPATADTDEMIEILRSRFDRMLFVGIRSLDAVRYTAKIRYKDLPQDGIGLAQYAHTHCQREIRLMEHPEVEYDEQADPDDLDD